MSSGHKNKFRILAGAAGLAVMTFLAGCASPITQGPKIDKAEADSAAQRQHEIRAAGRKFEAPDSPYVNYPVDQRLANVANRIFIAAAPYCDKTKSTYNIGVGAPDAGQPIVMDTQSSLRPGDRIVAVNGQSIPASTAGRQAFFQTRNNLAASSQQMSVDAVRGSQRISAKLDPVKSCQYSVNIPALIDPQTRKPNPMANIFNAYADGATVHITIPVMQKLRNDSDLGAVVGHELAHNAMKHIDSKKQNALGGLGIGAAIGLAVDLYAASKGINTQGQGLKTGVQGGVTLGAGAYSVDFEKEADYVGAYINYRAGYDKEAGQRVADRLALESKSSDAVNYATSHPATKDRAAAAESTEREIDEKKRTGQPLVPNLKSGKAFKIEN